MSHQFTAPERFRDELRDALLEHSATLPRRELSPSPAPGVVRPWAGSRVARRRLVPAVVLAALIAAAVLILRSGGAAAPQPANAAGVLNASAAALDHHGGPRALGPGEYFYSRVAAWFRYSQFSPHPYVVQSIHEEWLARDGRGRDRDQVVSLGGTRVSRHLPLTRSRDMQLRRPNPRPFTLSTVPAIPVSYAELRRLPTDPKRLSAALGRIASRYHVKRLFPQRQYRAAIRFEMLRELAELPTSASLRAALYRVLAATPGIRLLGPARDSVGRDGMALTVRVGDAQLELILNPATGELLQTSRTLLHRSKAYYDGKQPPGLINRATYLASGIVSSTRTRVP